MKGLIKAIFLTSTLLVTAPALSAQDAPDLLGIGKELGSQGQRITTLEETARETKREIHEFKQEFHEFKKEVKQQFDEVKQMIANSAAEANARFEKYFNQTDTRLKALEQPWGTNILSNVITDPLMIATSVLTYLGTEWTATHPYMSHGSLGLATLCFAQVLWNSFTPPVQYALLSGGAFVMAAAGSIYGLHQNKDAVGSTVKAVSGLAGAVSVAGVAYKAMDTANAKKKKEEL